MSQQNAAVSKLGSRIPRTPSLVVLVAVGGLLGFSRPTAAQFGPPPSYGAPSTLTLSTNPLTVAVADLNHDGKLDLVIPVSAAGNVMVLWGDGLGGFAAAPATVIGVGMFPQAAAVADLNGDTHPDIVVTNYGPPSDVSVLLGDGIGGFTAASGSPFAAGTNPFGVVIADMDADTFPDLVVANAGSNNVSVLLGNGTGAFGAATHFAVGLGPRDVAAADLNHDGLQDIVATNYAGTTASVLMGTGSGGFAAAVNYTTGSAPRTLALIDLNGDADLDAVVANAGSGSLSVLLGNGDGTFMPAVNYIVAAAGGASGVSVGDFNVDGKIDAAVTNANLTTITILNGDGAGNLQSPGTFFTAGSNPAFVGVGDFNGDHRDDLAVTNFGSGDASVFLNTLALSADLDISKTGPASAVAGQTVTYTTTVTNLGPNNAFEVSVADPTPSGLTFVSNTGDCTTAFPCSLGTVIAGQVRTITSTFLVPSGYSGVNPFTNTATVSSSTTDPAPANDSSTVSTAVTFSAEVSITKTDGVTTVVAGTPVTYSIVATNAGPSNAPSVTVADAFPAICTGANWTCAGAGGGSCAASGSGDISDTADLPSGGSATYMATCTIAASATGSLSNTATATVGGGVTDPTPGNNSATDTDTLTAQAEVSITKTDGVTTAVAGTPVTYAIVATNAGPSNAPSVTVADAFPAICTGANWTCAGAGGGSCSASGSGDISDTANLPSGGSATYTATCTIAASATGSLSNTATATVGGGVTDPAPGNNSASDTDTLTAQAEVSITKTDGVTTVVAGTPVTYSIVATNAGPSNAPSVTVADAFPAICTGANWTCAGAGGGSCAASGSGDIGDTANLPSGGSATYTATCTIAASATGSLSNTATATVGGGVTDPAPGNNSATDTDTLTAQADLSAALLDAPDPVVGLGHLMYIVTAANAGSSDASGVSVVHTLPAGSTFSSLTAVGWSCSTGTGTVTCTRPGLAAGATARFYVEVTVGPAGGTVTSSVTVSASTTDPNAANNSATQQTTVNGVPYADLSIVVTDGGATALWGRPLTYTLTVTNGGPDPVTGATVSDIFPVELAAVTWTCTASAGSSCAAAGGGNITDTTVDLLLGGTATYSATGIVVHGTAGPLVNTAAVSSVIHDPVAANNSSTVNTPVDVDLIFTDGFEGP